MKSFYVERVGLAEIFFDANISLISSGKLSIKGILNTSISFYIRNVVSGLISSF